MLVQSKIEYQYDGKIFEGVLVYPNSVSNKLPALVMFPNWLGITEGAISLANYQAQQGYIVFIIDLYGKHIRPKTNKEANEAMLPLRHNTNLLRAIMHQALTTLMKQATTYNIDTLKIAAFGFCFGGCCALELARSGADIKAAISFHGNLDTPNPQDAKNIKGSILVLDGANDPLVPRSQLTDFMNEMNAAKVDWQLVSYGGAVHGFTDMSANEPGVKQYNAKVTKRAFNAMNDLLSEVFAVN